MARLAMAQRRELLIEAAWQVLLRGGVRAATTRAICAEANMPQSSFHYCFESRAELLRMIVIGLIPRHIERTFGAIEGSGDEHGFVIGPLRAFFDDVEQHPMHHAVLYDITLNSIYDPELADLAEYQYAEYQLAARSILERVADERSLTWDLPIDSLASMLLDFLDGMVLRYVVDHDRDRAIASIDAFGHDLAGHATRAGGDRKTAAVRPGVDAQ